MHKVDITSFIENPKYRLTVRKSVASKTIKIISTDNFYEQVIEVKFPYDETVISEIRKFKNEHVNVYASWDKESSAWHFALNEENILFLMKIFNTTEFNCDDEFTDYVEQIQAVIDNIENHVPMLVLTDKMPKIKNSSKYMPEIASSDLVKSIFQARQLGVNLWDQTIDEYIDDGLVDQVTRDFLKSNLDKITKLTSKETDILCLKNIITHLGPTMFIIPGVNELEKLQQMHAILTDMNIDSENISVLFRLDSESGKNFNDFVKNAKLNNPITEQTKMVFVSNKLPKPLIKSNLKFNSIVNLGFDSAHYTLRDYAKNHQNMVLFDAPKSQRGINFANL
jgi:preprotein translocase subunit SecD